jgi:putative ABC transport system permease protein
VIKSYLLLAWKVLLRRKFFTFISLFGISFTLVVLMLVTSLVDHVVAGYPPETKHASTVNIAYSMLKGEHSRRNGFAGFGLLDKYAPCRTSRCWRSPHCPTAHSYFNGQRIKSFLKRTDSNFWRILDLFHRGRPYRSDVRATTGWSPSSTDHAPALLAASPRLARS